MDFLYIEGQPVLHMVNEATRFSAGTSVSLITTESQWETILKLWADAYTRIPNKQVLDGGS